VYCDAFVVARYEYGVSSQPARPVERGAELAEVLVALRDLPEEEVDLRPDADARVRAEAVEAAGEVLDRLGKRVLVRGPLLDRQPAPGGLDAEEGVGDVLAACRLAHAAYGTRMPVVQIRALPQQEGVDVEAALVAVSHAVAFVLGEEPRGTWATWETIDAGCYVEGAEAPAVQPRGTHPPLVSVRAFEGRSPELVERILLALAETLAAALDLEAGNVFAAYDELGSGRLYTGGAIARTAG
jgi:hypothetical protein